MTHHANLTQEMRECIERCLSCHATCLETVTHSLGLGGQHARGPHIARLLSCAEMCQTSANFMLYGSDFHPQTCDLCAEICRVCADECRQMAAGDAIVTRCAEACDRCAESCERMSHAAV